MISTPNVAQDPCIHPSQVLLVHADQHYLAKLLEQEKMHISEVYIAHEYYYAGKASNTTKHEA
jgi:hypothetical protein